MSTLTGVSTSSGGGVSSAVITEINNTIDDLSNNVLALSTRTFNSSVGDSTEVDKDIGGLDRGTLASDLKSKTLDQIMDIMFFPTLQPNIVNPSPQIDIDGDEPDVYLVGTQITYDIGVTFSTNNNRVTLGGSTADGSQPYSGSIDSAKYAEIGSSSYVDFASFSSYNSVTTKQDLTRTITEGINGKAKIRIKYLAGSYIPVDSKGVEVGTAFSNTGNFSNSSNNYEGVYQRFINTSSGQTTQALESSSTNEIEISQQFQETNSSRHGWEFPDLIFVGRSWIIQTYDNFTNEYIDMADQGQFTIDDTTTKVVNGVTVGYRKYTKNTTGKSSGNEYRLRYT